MVTADHLVYEHYDNDMHGARPHQMMSVTKSFAGLFALLAAADGLLDERAPVVSIVPELAAASAFATASIGEVDMVNSMEFSEDYADPESDIQRYVWALGWMDAPPGSSVGNLYDFLQSLSMNPEREHGEAFQYQTPKTDVVNWITNRATGSPSKTNWRRCCGRSWEPKARRTSCWTGAAHSSPVVDSTPHQEIWRDSPCCSSTTAGR